MSITVAVQSKVYSNTGIVGSNLTEGMDVCFYFVCVQVEAFRRADTRPRGPIDSQKLRNSSERKLLTDALCFRWEQQ
jgi:hypothetical protein